MAGCFVVLKSEDGGNDIVFKSQTNRLDHGKGYAAGLRQAHLLGEATNYSLSLEGAIPNQLQRLPASFAIFASKSGTANELRVGDYLLEKLH